MLKALSYYSMMQWAHANVVECCARLQRISALTKNTVEEQRTDFSAKGKMSGRRLLRVPGILQA